MVRIKLSKVKGTSLVEVLTATVVLVIVLGIATFIFYRISSSTYTFQKKKADLLLGKISYECIKEKKFFDEESEVENFIIRKEVKKYLQSEDLLWIDLKAFDHEEKLISERKELILVHE